MNTMDFSASLVTLRCSSSRRTPSLSPLTSSLSSSSSSSSSLLEPSDFPELRHGSLSPFYPLSPVASSRVPFSWEKIPGIPKSQLSWKTEARSPSTSPLLPLPPAAASAASSLSSKKHWHSRTASASRCSSKRDPFVLAFVKCSKDDGGREMTGNLRAVANVSRRITDGLGLVNLASCKQTCAVSDSVVYVVGSNRASSDLFRRGISRA